MMDDTYFGTVIFREFIFGVCRSYKLDMKDRKAECMISYGSEIYYKKEYKFDEIHFLSLQKFLELKNIEPFVLDNESYSKKTNTSIEFVGFTYSTDRRLDCYYERESDYCSCPLVGLYNHIVSHFFPRTKHLNYSVNLNEIGEMCFGII